MEAYGSVLRSHRWQAGLTQDDLSERSAVSRSTIQNLELGIVRVPRRAAHRLLLDALAPFLGAQEQAELSEAFRSAKRQAFRATRREQEVRK